MSKLKNAVKKAAAKVMGNAPDGEPAQSKRHKHDFKPTGNVDAGRPVERCDCGETRVEGEPTTRSR